MGRALVAGNMKINGEVFVLREPDFQRLRWIRKPAVGRW